MTLPGTRLLRFARLVIDRVAVERVLEPLVADWQCEWSAATTAPRRALVWARGAVAFVWSSVCCLVLEGTPQSMKGAAWVTLAALTALTVVLDYASWIGTLGALGALWVVPGSLITSTWFAIFPLAIRLGAERDQRTVARRHLARIVLAVTVCAFVTTNWIFPMWIRAVRDQLVPPTVHRPLAMGGPELTLPQLLSADATRLIGITSFYPPASRFDQQREVERELHNRATFALMPAALAMLGWSLARTCASARWLSLALWTTLNFVLWVALRGFPPVVPLPPLVSLWAPLLVWTFSSAALMWWSTKRLAQRA